MANIFAQKKQEAKTGKAKKEEKTVITIEGDEFAEKLARFNAVKKDVKNLSAEMKTLEGDIKGVGVEKYMELYEKLKRNPGSFKIASNKGEKIMVIAADRYMKIDTDTAEELVEDWGEEVVEEHTTYAFNNDLLDKHQEDISDMFMNADFLTDEEKENLIEVITSISVKKGIINEAMTVGKGEVRDFLGSVQPVISLKDTK